jgi:hypothetical protein
MSEITISFKGTKHFKDLEEANDWLKYRLTFGPGDIREFTVLGYGELEERPEPVMAITIVEPTKEE